jgi:ABC-2 type transport system ATP-binding protein
MEHAGIVDMAATLIGHLSRGYRQRVGLADALVASPSLLILDEPTAGLDPNQIREVRALIRRIGEEHTVLLSTHILSEVETTCDRAIVIHRGRLVAQGSIAELREQRQGTGARLVLRDENGRAASVLEELVAKQEATLLADGQTLVEIRFSAGEPAARLERVVEALVHAGIGVREAGPVQASLEEVFAKLTAPDTVSVPDPAPELVEAAGDAR